MSPEQTREFEESINRAVAEAFEPIFSELRAITAIRREAIAEKRAAVRALTASLDELRAVTATFEREMQ
ncbi:MAG: hypothetical protein ACLPV8_25455 [Steroidobacteraceae bacterium]